MKLNSKLAKWPFLFLTLLVSACSNFPKHTEIQKVTKETATKPVLFIADPQIHNIYGLGLKQMTRVSDLVSKVAVRHPELNILAPLVLEYLLKKGVSENLPNAIVVLGDATNISCSGEFDTYLKAIVRHKTDDMPLLMAHGNHDSYLMGTVNYYFPMDSQTSWKPHYMELATKPTDEGWWGITDVSSQHFRNWRDGCYQPITKRGGISSPMNKSRWLAKYMSFLEVDGMISESVLIKNNTKSGTSYELTLTAKSNSTLGKIKYKGAGIWHPPKFGDVPSKSFFTGTYKSFIVQIADIDNTRLIIIDTSVCEKAEAGWKFIFNNAGENACIGEEQLKIIKRYVESMPSSSKLVIAGHFPLKDLSRNERKKLFDIASSTSDWIYMSAHSHFSTSQSDWGTGSEINIGSTTDWPMEANSVWFEKNKSNAQIYTFQLDNDPITYKGRSRNDVAEVCRHLPAAEKLAVLDVKYFQSKWESPNESKICDVSNFKGWEANGLKLNSAVSIISKRFRNEPLYRLSILKIAAAASKAENNSFELLDLIP
jgi:hypothetical protein